MVVAESRGCAPHGGGVRGCDVGFLVPVWLWWQRWVLMGLISDEF